MKERPILFSAAMVRAILEGRKTQTRRVLAMPKHLRVRFPLEGTGEFRLLDGLWQRQAGSFNSWSPPFPCPYGVPGDRLWVRETWGVGSRPDPWGGYDGIEYRADAGLLDPNDEYDNLDCHKVETPEGVCLGDYRSGWHPSIHMPRWASRITLELTDVRVQRVQGIRAVDAIAEGIEPVVQMGAYQTFKNYGPLSSAHMLPVDSFHSLWDSINGKTYPWANNDWAWALTFKVLP